jgi:hypothetical protein
MFRPSFSGECALLLLLASSPSVNLLAISVNSDTVLGLFSLTLPQDPNGEGQP